MWAAKYRAATMPKGASGSAGRSGLRARGGQIRAGLGSSNSRDVTGRSEGHGGAHLGPKRSTRRKRTCQRPDSRRCPGRAAEATLCLRCLEGHGRPVFRHGSPLASRPSTANAASDAPAARHASWLHRNDGGPSMTEHQTNQQPMLELRRGGASGVRRLRPPGRSCRGATKAPAMERKCRINRGGVQRVLRPPEATKTTPTQKLSVC